MYYYILNIIYSLITMQKKKKDLCVTAKSKYRTGNNKNNRRRSLFTNTFTCQKKGCRVYRQELLFMIDFLP